MAPSPMDALSSFAYLTENIPIWLDELNTLSSHTTQKQTEFRSEYTRLINHLRPRKIKSPSMRSIHGSENERPKSRDSVSSKRSSLEISPLEAGNRQLFINARRRTKKTDVSIRSGASGPQKFRSRQMVVVHYDGHTQTALEGMVKNIGAARNNLRKGKQNRELSLGLELPAFKRRPGWDDDSTDLLGLNLKNATRMRFQSLSPKDNGSSLISEDPKRTAVFEEADKELEKGKNLCETAAHQFLRDGDCSAEIEGLKEAFNIVLELAKEEEQKLREEGESKVEAGDNELPESPPENAKSAPLQFLASVTGNGHLDATADVLLSEKSDAIEVDDGDGDASDLSVDFAAFRRTLRSGRVR